MKEISSSQLHDLLSDAISRRGWVDDGTAVPAMVLAARQGVEDSAQLVRAVSATFFGRNRITRGDLTNEIEKLFKDGGLIIRDESRVTTMVNVTGGSNVTVAVGSLIGRIENTIHDVPDRDVRQALERLVDSIRTDGALREAERTDALERLEFLSQQAAANPNGRSMAAVRDVVGGLVRIVEVSASLATLWQAAGPTIVKFFGL